MKGLRVSYRYAKSLLGLAIEQNLLEQVYADMSLIADTSRVSRDFVVLLRSPIVKTDKKISVIEKVFEGRLSPISSGFIRIITRHHRENYLPEIAESFVSQYKAYKQIAQAEVTTATALDTATRERIIRLVEQTEGRKVEIDEKVDPSILGGLIVKVGDKQYDGSISRKLKELKKDFSKNAYISKL